MQLISRTTTGPIAATLLLIGFIATLAAMPALLADPPQETKKKEEKKKEVAPWPVIQAKTPGKEVVRLFNGKDFTGLMTWGEKSGTDNSAGLYTIADGQLRIAGLETGYVGTIDSWRDYRLVVEYKWGVKTDGRKFVRNSGILLHAVGPEANFRRWWMSSIEAQLAQAHEGDFIVIRGKDAMDREFPVTLSSETVMGPDGKTRWKPGGQKRVYADRQFWWSNHDHEFKELMDTRGRFDSDTKSP